MKSLSYYICILIIGSVLLPVSGCKKENIQSIKQTSFDTPFDLKLSDKVLVVSPQRQIMVELRSLNDSRCTTTPCEASGSAQVRVFLSDADNHAVAETNLCIGDCNINSKTSDTASVTIDKVTYKLVLKNISATPAGTAQLQLSIM